MSLEDELIEQLEDFGEKLRRGERIVTTTVERCGCNEVGEVRDSIAVSASNCHLCGGKGWLFSCNTLLSAIGAQTMKTKVELEIDIPDGYEATGERRPPLCGEWFLIDCTPPLIHQASHNYQCTYIILRRVPDPVEKWLAEHPWLPEGCWVYYNSNGYGITDLEPWNSVDGRGYYMSRGAIFVFPNSLAKLFGREFTPPPVDCLQVLRKSDT